MVYLSFSGNLSYPGFSLSNLGVYTEHAESLFPRLFWSNLKHDEAHFLFNKKLKYVLLAGAPRRDCDGKKCKCKLVV